jgi:hypothetical protein
MSRSRLRLSGIVTTLVTSASALGASAATAHADGYLIAGGGIRVPLGDSDWQDLVETSPSLQLGGGTMRKIAPHSRLGLDVSFSYSPLASNANSLFRVDLSQFRALVGFRLEQLVARGALFAFHGGIGIDHLRAEVSSDLFPDRTETDTGLALDVGGGFWFSAGPVLLGVELGLPIGRHHRSQSAQNVIDFQSIDLAVFGGARFQL